ncbi:MAG: isoprenylcysteine carboxylmethyltransferase family protein [Halioglobus sp.]|nr:isoprenylcysteine carboxylmethyltransferase family protein [Halioglobus sp.]
MWALSRGAPLATLSFPSAGWVAAGFALAGVGIAVLGVLAFRQAETTVDPRSPEQSSTLVVRGVYRYSRNPMYLGFFLVLCAWGVFLGSISPLLLLPAFVVYTNRFQIAPEERFMREKFGESYSAYSARVRRWV